MVKMSIVQKNGNLSMQSLDRSIKINVAKSASLSAFSLCFPHMNLLTIKKWLIRIKTTANKLMNHSSREKQLNSQANASANTFILMAILYVPVTLVIWIYSIFIANSGAKIFGMWNPFDRGKKGTKWILCIITFVWKYFRHWVLEWKLRTTPVLIPYSNFRHSLCS